MNLDLWSKKSLSCPVDWFNEFLGRWLLYRPSDCCLILYSNLVSFLHEFEPIHYSRLSFVVMYCFHWAFNEWIQPILIVNVKSQELNEPFCYFFFFFLGIISISFLIFNIRRTSRHPCRKPPFDSAYFFNEMIRLHIL